MRSIAALAAAAWGAAACAAPQSPGWKRDTYLAASTVDGVFLGAIGGMIVVCVPFFMSHDCPDRVVRLSVPAGAVVGGATSYWLTDRSERSPDRIDWVAVYLLPATLGAVTVIGLVAKGASRLARTLRGSPRPDRTAEPWGVYFASREQAIRFATGLGEGCELDADELAARKGDAEAAPDPLAYPCEVIETDDGRWRVGVGVMAP